MHGSAEAFERLVAEPQGKEHEHERVGKRGESAGAMVTVGLLGISGALRPTHREPGNAERGDIGKIVDRVIKQSDRTPEKTADDFSNDQAQCGDHRPPEDGRLKCRMRMRVRMTMAMMRVSGKAMAVLVRRFGGIARRGPRSLRLLLHPEIV